MDKPLHEITAEYHAASKALDAARSALFEAQCNFARAQQAYVAAMEAHRQPLQLYSASALKE